uniref:Uncharacterized protein n=1 Tax=Ovis aries TaxID=9940 RepID=A0AC11DWX1_SHEEP
MSMLLFSSSHPLLPLLCPQAHCVHLLLHSFPAIPMSFGSEPISALLQPLIHGNHSSVFCLYSFAFSRMLYKEIIQNIPVRTGHETTDWFQMGKGVHQGCILSPCLFNIYAEYIMRNAWLDEAQAGIKIDRTNINNLRYADDTTLMAESEEELKSLLMKVKEESEKAGLKLNIQNTNTMSSGPITSWQTDGETMEAVTDFIFWGSKIIADGDCSHEIKRRLFLGRKALISLDSIFKSRDITLPTKVCLVKAMLFPVVMYGCESWTVKKVEH